MTFLNWRTERGAKHKHEGKIKVFAGGIRISRQEKFIDIFPTEKEWLEIFRHAPEMIRFVQIQSILDHDKQVKVEKEKKKDYLTDNLKDWK